MYLTILKKDLRRKRAMNLIFTVFVMLASAFIGSSIQSLSATVGGVDSYLKKAGVGDYLIGVSSGTESRLESFINNSENVRSSWLSSVQFLISKENVKKDNGKEMDYNNSLYLTYPMADGQKYFDSSKEEITHVKKGECYLPYSLMSGNDLKAGDKLIVTLGDTSLDLTVRGEMLDAVMGSDFISIKRILLNREDYEVLLGASESNVEMEYKIYSIDVKDMQGFTNEFLNMGITAVIDLNYDTLKMTYIIDIIIAVIFGVVSVVLIIIALVVLRFTVIFTLEQEYREIGILKALGIKNSGIRLLYLAKYIFLTVIGSLLGLVLCVPLGNVMSAGASRRIMLEEDNTLLLQGLAALAVLAVVLLLGYFYTGRIKKISPITAIRSGSTGESFSRSSALTLKHAGALPLPLFLSMNDILSGVKKYAMMMLIFTLGVIMINIPANAVSTLRGDGILLLMNMAQCDGALIYESTEGISQTRAELEKELEDIERKLEDNGVEARAFREVLFLYTLNSNGILSSSIAVQGINTDTDDYLYSRGTPPKLENEVAITANMAEKTGADIGDTVKITMGSETREFIVTALYESLSNMGQGIRFPGETELDYTQKGGLMAVQLDIAGDPGSRETEQKLKEIQDIFPEYEVISSQEHADRSTGVSEILDWVSWVILLIVLAINALISVLMVRSFISRERGNTAMLKSLGFRDRTLVLWQSLRISLVLAAAMLLAALVTMPLSNWILKYIFGIMGTSRITVVVDPLMSYCVYPLILFAVTTVCALLSALRLKKIKAREINNIE